MTESCKKQKAVKRTGGEYSGETPALESTARACQSASGNYFFIDFKSLSFSGKY